MSTVAQMFAYEDGNLSGGYSTENFMEVRTEIRLVMLCIEICLRNVSCMSVFYNTVTKACRLHENVFYNADSFVSEAGWHYYRAVGDPKCDVYNGFVHQRDARFCYRAESDLLTKALADSACAAKTSALAILDSQKKQDVVVATLNLLSTKAPAAAQETTVQPVRKGCYNIAHVDNISNELTNLAITVQMCFDICKTLGKTHTLLEIQRECYCGDLQASATKFPDSTCNTICGDGEWCGNLSGMLATYEHVSTTTAGPSFVGFYIGATLNTATNQWFWRDSVLLAYSAFDATDDSLSSETCAVMASDVSYKWYSEACTYTAGYICQVDL